IAELPRRRRAPTAAGVGPHALGGAPDPDGRTVVAHRVPGRLHSPDRPRDAALRRLAAGPARSPDEKPLGLGAVAHDAILQISGLQTDFCTLGGTRVVRAVDGVDFTLRAGETLGLVGESGSGKTTTCLSIVGLLPRAARIVGGRVVFEGEDLARKSQRELRRIRGRRIAVILQDPMASLNPL